MPSCPQSGRVVKEILEIYLNGNKDHAISSHAVPVLGDRAKYVREGKVMKRLRTDDVRLPFLL